MLFQSWQYLLLLIAAMIGMYFLKNATAKRVIIVALSLIFYAYGAEWQTVLFVAIITVAYAAGRCVEKTKNKLFFSLLLIGLFLPLLLYKYVPFLLTELFGEQAKAYTDVFLLPIGISFYTFQAAGYVIDVYRDSSKAEHNFLTFACFISFFPQLVAGPIERRDNIMPQIRNPQKANYAMMRSGFRHVLLGLCLKLLVAETMSAFVDPVYNNLEGKGGLAILIATLCFGIQIYCDFNGYTQIAIGSAELVGIRLMQNFNHPYRAQSITDFWRRWHISLTTWFKDYLYIPLGGNRKGSFRTALNSIITFLVSGIWHGANWTFALWGLANGVAMAIEKPFLKKISKNKIVSAFYAVFCFCLINLFWVFFRANTIQDAFFCLKMIFTDTIPQLLSLTSVGAIVNFLIKTNGWSAIKYFSLLVSGIVYIWYEYGRIGKNDLSTLMHSKKAIVRWALYFMLIGFTLYFGGTLAQSDFVYFRF